MERMITFGQSDARRRRLVGLAAAGCVMCGAVLVVMPGKPWLSETLGAAVTILSLVLLISGHSKAVETAGRTDLALLPDQGPTNPGLNDPGSAPEQHAAVDPQPLACSSSGTTRDFATAMGMFGGEIVEQVETS